MSFLLALVRFCCSSTLCRFLTGQEQAITPTITQRALPDCGEGGSEAAERHKPGASGLSEVRRTLKGGAPARMVSDKSARFQVGWTKRRAEGEGWARRGKLCDRTKAEPRASGEQARLLADRRDAGRNEVWDAALETAAAAACPRKLEQTAICAYADGTAR